MVLRILILSLVSLLAAWPVLRSELPAVIGPVWASGAGERWSVKILLPLLFVGALVCAAWGVPVRSAVLPAFPSSDLPSLFAIVLSTLAAVSISSLISPYTAVPFAFLGSIAGFRLVTEGALDWTFAARMVAAWVVAPLLCGLLAAGIVALVVRRPGKRAVHLAVSDHRLLSGCVLATFLLVGASAWNLGSIIAFFPVAAFGNGLVSAAVATVPALLLFLSVAVCLFIGVDHQNSFIASVTSLGNVGPAYGALGTMGSFNSVPLLGKLVFTLDMFLGRIEIYPVLAVVAMVFDKRARG